MAIKRRSLAKLLSAAAAGSLIPAGPARAATGRELSREAGQALADLYAAQPKARQLARRAKAVLVFPRILKAGLVIGGQGGDGALLVHGKTVGYFTLAAASFGLQAGAQTFSYALFFMTEASLSYLSKSDGWAIGSGPSVVVLDKGAAASLTSTTLTQDVYAFAFGQSGLMAGLGLEGSKITRIHPAA